MSFCVQEGGKKKPGEVGPGFRGVPPKHLYCTAPVLSQSSASSARTTSPGSPTLEEIVKDALIN